MLKALAQNQNSDSLAAKLRRRRFELVLSLLEDLPRPAKILDVGGTQRFWEIIGTHRLPECSVTLLNRESQPVTLPAFRAVAGDARSLPEFADGEFDFVFSNSVIEHVGGRPEQARMAAEIRRVGKRYCVQTPNKYFPIEPHFLLPGVQFLPVGVRAWLLNHFDLGWWPREPDPVRARAEVESIQLLTARDLRALFPDGAIWIERFAGLPKSFLVYGPATHA